MFKTPLSIEKVSCSGCKKSFLPTGYLFCKKCVSKMKSSTACNTAGSSVNKQQMTCANAKRGCSFKGSKEILEEHHVVCEYEKVQCWVCFEKCLFKDFYQHNSKNCFKADARNSFKTPFESSFYLVKEEGVEVLVMLDLEYLDGIGVKTFAMKRDDEKSQPKQLKLTVESSPELEIIFDIKIGPGTGQFNVLIPFFKEGDTMQFSFCDN